MIEPINRCARKVVVLLYFAGLAGCATLDPDGEWRGTPEARLRSCQAMFGSAVISVREQVAAATGASAAQVSSAGAQCSAPGITGAPRVPAASAPRSYSPQELSQLASDAERAYVDGRYGESVELLDAFLVAQPAHTAAWLRKGNALHRLERSGEAAMAYRRTLALTLDPAAAAHWPQAAVIDMRSKASANLAILGIEQAKHALDALGAVDSNPVAAAHRARIEAAMRAVIGTGADAAPSGPASTLGPASALIPASNPGLPVASRPLALAPAQAARQAAPVASPGVSPVDPSAASAASDPPLSRPVVEVIRGLVSR